MGEKEQERQEEKREEEEERGEDEGLWLLEPPPLFEEEPDWESYIDDVTGTPLRSDMVQAARAEELEWLRSEEVYEKVPKATMLERGHQEFCALARLCADGYANCKVSPCIDKNTKGCGRQWGMF